MAGVVRELLDQVLVGVAEFIFGNVGDRQRLGREVLDQVFERFIRQALAIGPRRVTENAVEQIWVGGFDRAHGLLDGRADIHGGLAYIVPMRAFGHLEAVVLGELGIGEVAT